eukprot:TRINITY_DN2321_c0_g1_i2.p1 TRINITY_DN2321_c0_g1~~TRINITY_DN2321_c0_g1_i2.p1  ORF type:complete len:434 (-),score=116.44 TRINITY_DN2321_c0_g1_i2:35-1336(-)
MKGDEDRQNLLSMDEVSRESILAQRFEERRRAQDAFQAKKRLKKGGRGAALRALRESRARKERAAPVNVPSVVPSPKSFKSRMLRKVEDEEKSRRKKERKRKEDDRRREEDKRRREEEQRQREELPDLDSMQKARLRRSWFESKIDEPWLPEAIRGLLVRVMIGLSADEKPVYRPCEIIETVIVKSYELAKKKTNIGLYVRYGVNKRKFHITQLSNGDFEESERKLWIDAVMGQSPDERPTLKALKETAKRFKDLSKTRYDDKTVNEMIEVKKKLNRLPTNYARTTATLADKLEIARAAKDQYQIEEIESQIRAHEEQKKMILEQHERDNKSINAINEKHRKENHEILRNEAKAQRERAQNADKQQAQLNPFARVRTRSSFMDTDKPKVETPAVTPVAASKSVPVTPLSKGVSDTLSFDLDIDLDQLEDTILM